ncbi:flagellar assembly factor FliW [Novimethylophilus kurashikiensis]|uniref:Flagellar assembly factor FliW n=1 Tax=Novimethylophilus kurashikiensis TaxID=1825523 RepID=A0A2R5F681_9PROT|nr:flagellar assembly protein FliW [Novimethylophilus kurashikiensis]GBG13802.1 flagellar assembly factor FliW [Novimethylophilus kurashikiensis]
MKFTLTRFGSEVVDIDPQTVVSFPRGIAPFDKCTQYKLFHEEGKPSVFWLQSLDEADILFSVTDPSLLNLNYDVTLSEEEQALLEAEPGEELLLAVILYKNEMGVQANSRAPIILNINKRLGLQKTLQEIELQVSIKGS